MVPVSDPYRFPLELRGEPHVLLVTWTFRENSEVSPIAVPVAVPLVLVAVMVTLSATARASEVQVKVGESPSRLVAVVVSPRKVWPSPWLEGSPSALKHWMV